MGDKSSVQICLFHCFQRVEINPDNLLKTREQRCIHRDSYVLTIASPTRNVISISLTHQQKINRQRRGRHRHTAAATMPTPAADPSPLHHHRGSHRSDQADTAAAGNIGDLSGDQTRRIESNPQTTTTRPQKRGQQQRRRQETPKTCRRHTGRLL
jgi:hypothetical protein